MQSDNELQSLFLNDMEYESLVLETGFRIPLCRITCADKASVKNALRDYHSLVKIKSELDQFADGLKIMGVLQAMRKYPSWLAPLLSKDPRKLTRVSYSRE